MRIKKASFVLSLVATLFLTPAGVEALEVEGLEVSIQPRFEMGATYYKYEQPAATVIRTQPTLRPERGRFVSGQESFSLGDTMFSFGGGITLFADRFFMDLSAYKAVNGQDNPTIAIGFFDPTTEQFFTASPTYKADFDRAEYAVSLGYNVTDRLAVFAGYKWASTDFETTFSGPGTIVIGRGIEAEATLDGKYNFSFDNDGPFLGVAYGWNIDRGALKGTLITNLALGFLSGEIKERTAIATVRFPSLGIVASDNELARISQFTTGDTVGWTLGIAWRGLTPIKNLTYSLGINGYQYRFNADDSIQPDITETEVNLRAGVAYSF
jgi:hypothetical protein